MNEQNYQRLSDAELRHELQKHGFPNLPITETTRNILIKKLKQCKSGKTARAGARSTSALPPATAQGNHDRRTSPRIASNNRLTLTMEPGSSGASSNIHSQHRTPMSINNHVSSNGAASFSSSQQRRLQINSSDNNNNDFHTDISYSDSPRTSNNTNYRNTSSRNSNLYTSPDPRSLLSTTAANNHNCAGSPSSSGSVNLSSGWYLRAEYPYDKATNNNLNHQQHQSLRSQISHRPKIHVPPPIIALDTPQQSFERDLSNGIGSGNENPHVVSRLLKLRDINLRRPPANSNNMKFINNYLQTDSDSDGGGGNGDGNENGGSPISKPSGLPLSTSMAATQRYFMMSAATASNSATATLNNYRNTAAGSAVGLGKPNIMGNNHHPTQVPYYHHHYPHHYASRHERLTIAASKNAHILNLKHKFQQSSIPFLLMSSMGLFFAILALLYLNKPPDILSTMLERSATFVLCDDIRNLQQTQFQEKTGQYFQPHENQLYYEQKLKNNEQGGGKILDMNEKNVKNIPDDYPGKSENASEKEENEVVEKIQGNYKKEDEIIDLFDVLCQSQGEWQNIPNNPKDERDSPTVMMDIILIKPSVNCIEKDLLSNAINLNRELIKLLQANIEAHYCRNSEINPTVSIREFIKHLHQKLMVFSKMNANSLLRNLQATLYLIENNPQWKIIVVNNKSLENNADATGNWKKKQQHPLDKEEILELEFNLIKPYLPLQCVLRHKMKRFCLIIGTVFLLIVLSLLFYAIINFVLRQRQLHQIQVENFTKAILKELMLQAANNQHNHSQNNSLHDTSVNDLTNRNVDLPTGTNAVDGGEVIINHLRDKLLTINRRRSHLRAWNDALQRLEANDSRIHFGTILKNGELFRTMKWTEICPSSPSSMSSTPLSSPMIPNALHNTCNASFTGNGPHFYHHSSLDHQQQQQLQYPYASTNVGMSTPVRRYRKKEWQSPAFDNVNNTFEPPTPCLKIRHMFDSTEVHQSDLKQSIIIAILEKVGPMCRINDIQLDLQSCCVYIRCASEADAGVVHREINGWWFDNRLVSIKFLRLQRYLTRFPPKANGNNNSANLAS